MPAFALSGAGRYGRGQPGRPVIAREVRDLIRQMFRESPGWGAPRIHGGLLKLDIDIGKSSVSKQCCVRPSAGGPVIVERVFDMV